MVICLFFLLFLLNIVREIGTRDRQYSASRPLRAACAMSSDVGKCPSSVSPNSPPCTLSHVVARLNPWYPDSRWWSFEVCLALFSLSCMLQYRAGPWFYGVFISVPYLLIVLHGPNFYYISFDLFQLSPSIEIDYIFRFQFGPHSFNFWIGFNPLIYLVQRFWFFQFYPLIEIDNIFGFHFSPLSFNCSAWS